MKAKQDYVDRGINQKNNGDFISAIQTFSQVLQLDPNCKPALNHLADIFEIRNELELALTYHYRILKLEPNQINKISRLNKIYSLLKKIVFKIHYAPVETKESILPKISEALLFIYHQCTSNSKLYREICSLIEQILLSLTFFTIDIGKKSGFTDQLMQFSIYYKLGQISGMNYVHTNFYSPRSSEFIYDFLGFNAYWNHININNIKFKNECKKIEFQISKELLFEREIYSLSKLIKYVKNYLLSQYEPNQNLLLVFPNIRDAREGLSQIVNMYIPYFPDGLNLQDCYFKKHKINLNHRPSTSERTKVSSLIHIRLGDTGIIESPWGSFMSLKNRKIYETTEFPQNRIKVSDFYQVVSLIQEKTQKLNISFRLFSDGYSLTFKSIINTMKSSQNKDRNKINELKKYRVNYEAEEFDRFDSLKLEKKCIGESDENLFSLIHSAFNSQLFITSINQRMIPKLLGLFPNPTNKQVLVMLSKSNDLDFKSLMEVGLSLEKVHLFNININKDIEKQIDPLVELISAIA